MQERRSPPSWGSRWRVGLRLVAWLLEIMGQGFSLIGFLFRRKSVRARFHRLILENGDGHGTLSEGTASGGAERETKE